jgi:hypothetical protein
MDMNSGKKAKIHSSTQLTPVQREDRDRTVETRLPARLAGRIEVRLIPAGLSSFWCRSG